ncbi:hypothetical protein DSO57_1001805 [Entomophthora muscae]|uniref:Uncharacterized protein n=1 Tax=Entomophthora muscae TaxID=34485 RepID=A0ACC2U7D2_9FUNG|nr:hypothetical protein DSO57_1001805 [Entomophthora muscae]
MVLNAFIGAAVQLPGLILDQGLSKAQDTPSGFFFVCSLQELIYDPVYQATVGDVYLSSYFYLLASLLKF